MVMRLFKRDKKPENEEKKDKTSESEKTIKKAAELIARTGFDGPAIFMLEVMKPFVYMGGQFARFFLAPFLPIFGETGDNVIETFEQQQNIEKIIQMIEEMKKEEEEKKARNKMEKAKKGEVGKEEVPPKRKWRFWSS